MYHIISVPFFAHAKSVLRVSCE